MDGRPPDLPGDAVGGGGHAERRPRRRARCRSGTPNEIASPHYYGVTFENGIKTEIAPTDHAAMFRFTFPGDDVEPDLRQRRRRRGGLTIDRQTASSPAGPTSRSGLSNGATRMFVYATFDKPITASEQLPTATGRRPATRASTPRDGDHADRDVADQRRAGAAQPRARDRRRRHASRACAAARSTQWDDKLGVIEVEGATEDQRTTLYSNLYRLFLYPNSAHENTGTRGTAGLAARGPVLDRRRRRARRPQTGAPVVDGKVYVNNGFWDTYRTTWSAYSLFTPRMAGELVDGFVQQYRDGGWISRWSSPGYANLMTGTSSDVAFADAYVKGVRGFDAARRLRRGAQERDRGAAGRPVQPERRAQGPRAVALPRLHAVARVRGRLVGARGLHQRLRHRQHGRAARRRRRARAAERRRYAEERRVLPQPRAELREHVRPGDRLLPGPRRGRDAGSPRRRTTTRACGATSTTTRRPTAGTSPSTRRTTARAWRTSTAAATRLADEARHVLRHPGDRQVPRLLRRHRSTRWSRRATCGWASGASPTRSRTTSRTCTTTPGSRTRRRRRCARCCAGSTSARRSARATPATRTTARRPPGTCSARSASTRCRSAARTTRSARRCSSKATVRPGERPRARRQGAATTSRAQRLRAGPAGSTGRRHDRAYLRPPRARATAATLDFDMGPAPSAWATGPMTRSAVDHAGQRAAGAAARRHRRRRRRGERRRAVRRRLAHDGGGRRRRSTYRVRRRRSACASTRSPRAPRTGGDPRGWVLKGSNDGATLEGARRAPRRDVPLALADAAVQGRRARRSYAHYRIESGAAATLGEVELLDRRAGRHLAARDRRSSGAVASAGETVPRAA